MEPKPAFSIGQLYGLQDRALTVITDLDTGFYLSEGTAASRGYLGHRFSDDLDLFVDDDERFALWSARIIQALSAQSGCELQVLLRESRFVRLMLTEGETALKIEMINDVPARAGPVHLHPSPANPVQ